MMLSLMLCMVEFRLRRAALADRRGRSRPVRRDGGRARVGGTMNRRKLLAAAAAIAFVAVFSADCSVFGYRIYGLPNDGMEPTFKKGSQLLVRMLSPEEIRAASVPDVVVFRSP